MTKVSKGDQVQWQTSQGNTEGMVTRKVTGPAKAGGHVAEASPRNPNTKSKARRAAKRPFTKPVR